MNEHPIDAGRNPLSDDAGDLSRKPFVEHLQDLRATLIWSLACYLAGMVVCFPLVRWILGVLRKPLFWAGVTDTDFLRIFRVTDGFSVFMRIVGWGGLILAAPFILVGVAWFVFPALRKAERKRVLGSALVCVVLFVAGIFLAYRWILPLGLRWLIQLNAWLGVSAFIELDHYLRFMLQGLVAFGLAFQTPVVITVLGYMGILTSGQLRRKRRYAIVVLMAIAAVLTPPDPWTMVMLSIPLIILYEVCIMVVAAAERRRHT